MVRFDLQMKPVGLLEVLYKGKEGVDSVYTVGEYKRYNQH